MTTSATGSPSDPPPNPRRADAFTLVELLSVVAIMAVVMSILGYAISNMSGSATQVAAAQVASGLSLARQLAIAKNTETRFVIAGAVGAGGAGLPAESWRYWTIIMTNKLANSPADNSWFMMKEWEKLPQGAVFLNVANNSYNTINEEPIRGTIGVPHVPVFSFTIPANQTWRGFASFGPFNVTVTNRPNGIAFRLTNTPAIGYNGVGEALSCSNSPRGSALGGNSKTIAVRVAAGAVDPQGQIILKSTNNYFYVETDSRGRVRVRSPESYRPEK